ncbi:acetylglutamate kinase [Anoxybacillus sp. B7M1]|jgi:acetylglutamate kinase|uniref:acetylglutamate kinase n=1 Tax=Anoxybacillaceae TaxID=3120669 RepID=UPI0005CD0539|nr:MULTISPECIES: acetylglutamate kinase [Anoxybacillus]ANB56039.1 acetylglutamate kinase [Anoxybacillus sp. B2M1]ANB63515.1 acetylglutamate kinase [Anoxybacillus sp. B7M1]KXG10153.1 Acetylglutamate kinase [Anoxybacillus sp. P3H1B]MBS2770502.1 acetylglutamate kinase [Anoxybacillus rupiensis]OQM46594.1 acetylglutamate kinase [Anoxybacillus sp. UARK-01]
MEGTIVIKCGGSVLNELSSSFFQSLQALHAQGKNIVIVHGGGPEIGQMLKQLAIESEFVNGLRKTTKEGLDVVEMVLAGKVNKQLVSLLWQYHLPGAGVSGVDGRLLEAAPLDLERLGYVGTVTRVNASFLAHFLRVRYIPVIAPIGCDQNGQKYNINADTAAGAIAQALRAQQLIFVTDVPGVLHNGSLVEYATAEEIEKMIEDGIISGGMIPKVKAALSALSDSLPEVMIVSGKHSFYSEGKLHGTSIQKEAGVC